MYMWGVCGSSVFVVVGVLTHYVCMVRCGLPALLIMWLCKPHTLEDNVMYSAIVEGVQGSETARNSSLRCGALWVEARFKT